MLIFWITFLIEFNIIGMSNANRTLKSEGEITINKLENEEYNNKNENRNNNITNLSIYQPTYLPT